MSTVLNFTDVPSGVTPEQYAKELDKKKAAEQQETLKKQQAELEEMTKNSKGGTEQMLERLKKSIDPELLDQFQIICSRVRWVDPDKKTVLWLHDLAGDPEAQHLKQKSSRDRFDGIVCVSDWQMQQYNSYLGLPYSESMVIHNAIEPVEIEDKEFGDQVRLIYHTTPHRGLEIVIPVYKTLYKKYGDKIHLDVYSSFNVYGWSQRDEQYKELFKECEDHPGITYHGYRPREEVMEALKKAHIFAFPSIWAETSCLSAIEALSAKVAIVCPNFATLPETTRPFSYMYQFSEDKVQHGNRFGYVMTGLIDQYLDKSKHQDIKNTLNAQKKFIDSVYSWDMRALQWTEYLKDIIAKKK
jgi:UDP-glucose:(glucosyl)LPS alpha-1,2-glucosyltransferase